MAVTHGLLFAGAPAFTVTAAHAALHQAVAGDSLRLEPGTTFAIAGGETVTGAPELARATLNLAMVHTDATAAADGRRLVFGGHTISIAAAHATRAVPALATILAWEGCDHLRPVHEGDVLRTEFTVEATGPGPPAGRETGERRIEGAAGWSRAFTDAFWWL